MASLTNPPKRGPKGDKGDPGPAGTTKRMLAIQMTSQTGGTFSYTYTPAFDVLPMVMPVLINVNDRTAFRLTSSTATGFTGIVESRNQSFLTLLGLDVLTGGVTPVVGATVRVFVVEQ